MLNLTNFPRSYCWIHGTAYIREHLQGKATGCFVDQSRIESEEDAPVSGTFFWFSKLDRFSKIFVTDNLFFSGDRLLPLVAFPAHLLLRLCQVPAQRMEELP